MFVLGRLEWDVDTMPVTNETRILDIDVEDLVDPVLSRAEGTVYAISEFDTREFTILHLAEATYDLYGDEETMEDHFERIHGYVHLDFTERELFTDEMFPLAERVEYLTTRMDYIKIVRIYEGDSGVFLALDPDEPVTPLAAVALEAMRGH